MIPLPLIRRHALWRASIVMWLRMTGVRLRDWREARAVARTQRRWRRRWC